MEKEIKLTFKDDFKVEISTIEPHIVVEFKITHKNKKISTYLSHEDTELLINALKERVKSEVL